MTLLGTVCVRMGKGLSTEAGGMNGRGLGGRDVCGQEMTGTHCFST